MKKTLTVIIALVLVVVMSVAGTVAYLTSQATVTNTFSVGKVAITLDETKVDVYGKKDGDTRVTENTYKLIPGHNYIKDPTVHVASDSENCWLFVKVEDGLADIEAGTTIAAQLATNHWTLVAGTSNVYAHKDIAKAGDNVLVFGTFTLKDDAAVDRYANAQIKVTAYAIQADGFDTAAEAWNAAKLA